MNDTDRQELTDSLNGIIWVSLWAPKGDPDATQLAAAASAFKLMAKFALDVHALEDVVETLSGANASYMNFLDDASYPDHPEVAAHGARLDAYRQERADLKLGGLAVLTGVWPVWSRTPRPA